MAQSLVFQLFDAAKLGNLERLEQLIPRISDAGMVRDKANRTLLITAATRGHVKCVNALIPISDPLAVTNCFGLSSLMCAALGGHAECVDALLPVSDPSMVDRQGNTAIDYATAAGHHQVAGRIQGYITAQVEARELALITESTLEKGAELARKTVGL